MLARLGLGLAGRGADGDAPHRSAVEALRTLGLWGQDGPLEDCWPRLEALAAAPNPDTALAPLARLAERRSQAWALLAADPPLLRCAAIVAGVSVALGDLLVSDEDALAVLQSVSGGADEGVGGDEAEQGDGGAVAWSAADVRRRAAGVMALGGDPPARALAGLQRRGLLRVAARDLLGLISTPTASQELSALAAGVLAAAFDQVGGDAEGGVRQAVIAMGKLGGEELNYVSDVDVIFVHDGDLGGATRTARRFLALLGEPTPAGRVYEIDASLRPEGRDGPLSRTLDAYQAYYRRWAKTWEFQALLKARPIAGDRDLGAAFMRLVEPFVWPDRLDVEAVAEIQRMKGVVESSQQVRRDGPRQLKLAPGGLRDIEFAVQLLQLVHGRHDRMLRSGNTLAALSALAGGGYVGRGDAALFAEAYEFLRTVEHRLQLRSLRRTHTLPQDDDDRYRLARAAGFRDIAAASALVQFDREYGRMQAAVRRLHEKLFYRPLLTRFAQLGADQLALRGESARERLVALGFRDAAGTLGHLEALAGGVGRAAQMFRTLLPAVLPILAEQPDPDGGLRALRELAERQPNSPYLLRTLRDNPPVAELLVRVLGRSRRVGEWLLRQPEVIGAMADLPALERTSAAQDYRGRAFGLVRRGSPTSAADALRRLRRREVARTAIRDLAGQAAITDVMAELTGLAEACLEAAVALAVPVDVRLAVIGMGKLGGGELGYASDLDVLFLFEPADARDEALAAVGRLLRLLSEVTPEGQAFEVDPNLRPEGRSGPIARTLESSRAYYERWAEPWELQALTQARFVAGDRALGSAFIEAVAPLVYPRRPPPERVAAVRLMKARIERERAGRPRVQARPGMRSVRPATGADLKLGPGGQSDVEWTVQLLQLRHGGEQAGLRGPGTLRGIEACAALALLPTRDARWLREGWLLLCRTRNAQYLAKARDGDRAPFGPEREHAAHLLGYAGGEALGEALDRAMRRIRKAHERAFYD